MKHHLAHQLSHQLQLYQYLVYKPDIDTAATDETVDEQGDVSLDEVTETENQAIEQDTSNEAENN